VTPDPLAIPTEINEQVSVASERQSSAWDIRNAPRNYLVLVGYQIASALFSFASVWLITRNLGSTGYGGIVAIIAASQVAQVLVNWTIIAVVRFGVDEFIETEKIARAFWVRLIILAVNMAVVLALSSFWYPPLATWLKLPPEARWLVLLHFAAFALWLHVQYALQAVKLPRVQGLLLMLERFLIFVALAGLLAGNSLTGPLAMVCYIAGPAAMIAVGAFRLRSFIFARFEVGAAFLKTVIVYSIPLVPMALVGYFSGSYLDAIFVSDVLSTRDLGIYAVATQLNGIFVQFPTLANALLIPLFITLNKEGGSQRIERFFKDVLPAATLFWAIFCLVVGFAGSLTLPFVFGPDFAGSVVPLWILLVSSSINVPVLLGYSALSHAVSATYVSMYAAIFSGLANVLFDLLLIPKYGLLGCALATVISIVVSVLTFAILLRRRSGIPVSWLPAAVLPTVTGGAILIMWGSPVFGLLTGLAAALLLAFMFMGSIKRSYVFARNIAG
jgi:O-antigen/teichoic acid export membrane protein